MLATAVNFIEPAGATTPTPSSIRTEVALVEDHVNVTVCPASILVGLTVIVTVGAGAGVEGAGVLDGVLPVPAADVVPEPPVDAAAEPPFPLPQALKISKIPQIRNSRGQQSPGWRNFPP